MIVESIQRERIPARCYWHRAFVILQTNIEVEGMDGRHTLILQPMLRRWSYTRHRWLYAVPGTKTVGTRQI
jgi:hypothetical protein